MTAPVVAPSTEQLAAQSGDAAGVVDEAGPTRPVELDADAVAATTRPVASKRDSQMSGGQMTVTQAIRLNRSKRKTLPPSKAPTRAARPAEPRAAWKDGLFPAVFGAIFSARWVLRWLNDGQVVLAVAVGLGATLGLFLIGIGASRWLSAPTDDPTART